MSYDPDDRRALAVEINRQTRLSEYPRREGSGSWGDGPTAMPPDSTHGHTVRFEGLPLCTPFQFKHLLTEALKMLQAKNEKIAQDYWGARGARYSVGILSAALNFTMQSDPPPKKENQNEKS